MTTSSFLYFNFRFVYRERPRGRYISNRVEQRSQCTVIFKFMHFRNTDRYAKSEATGILSTRCNEPQRQAGLMGDGKDAGVTNNFQDL